MLDRRQDDVRMLEIQENIKSMQAMLFDVRSTQVKQLQPKIDDICRALYGNGHEGLLQEHVAVKKDIYQLQINAANEKDFRRWFATLIIAGSGAAGTLGTILLRVLNIIR